MRRLGGTAISRAHFSRKTAKRRETHRLGAWTVPLKTHCLALRGGGSELEQRNEPRLVTRSTCNGTSQGSLRICARRTSTALPKRNPLWLRRTNKECLPYPVLPSRGTAPNVPRRVVQSLLWLDWTQRRPSNLSPADASNRQIEMIVSWRDVEDEAARQEQYCIDGIERLPRNFYARIRSLSHLARTKRASAQRRYASRYPYPLTAQTDAAQKRAHHVA